MVYRKDEDIRYGPAKDYQRARFLQDLRSCPDLFDATENKMLCDILDLAGIDAPLFRLIRHWLHEDAKYLGVDNKASIIQGCEEMYAGDDRAEWILDDVEKLLADPGRLLHVRAIHFDAFYGWDGQPLRESLHLLKAFIESQQRAHGDVFLLGLNVSCRGNRGNTARSFARLVQEVFPTVDVRDDIANPSLRYKSRKTSMVYATILFSPGAKAYMSQGGGDVQQRWFIYKKEQENAKREQRKLRRVSSLHARPRE